MGPPICTLLPPKKEIINPATIAVMRPFSGDTPEDIPSAIESGNAIIATIIPAITSFITCSLVIFFSLIRVKIFGDIFSPSFTLALVTQQYSILILISTTKY